jgi:DNA mismatch endonuclease (patch repair protein)
MDTFGMRTRVANLIGCQKTKIEYWGPKIAKNVSRDSAVHAALVTSGWRVYTLWECELSKINLEISMQLLKDKI